MPLPSRRGLKPSPSSHGRSANEKLAGELLRRHGRLTVTSEVVCAYVLLPANRTVRRCRPAPTALTAKVQVATDFDTFAEHNDLFDSLTTVVPVAAPRCPDTVIFSVASETAVPAFTRSVGTGL